MTDNSVTTPAASAEAAQPERRRFLAVCSALGLTHTLFPGAVLALAAQPAAALADPAQRRGAAAADDPNRITAAMIDNAAAIAGITIAEDQKAAMLGGINGQRDGLKAIRDLDMPNSVPPSFIFDPVPGTMVLETAKKPLKLTPAPKIAFAAGTDPETLAFLTVRELAELIKTKRVTSTTLTKMYIARLKRYDPQLHCVINLTEERALKQAAAMDAEIAAGKYRGPLHGIPWGGKDLLAVKGYPTTWGAGGFSQQMFEEDAEVVKRLDAAGAVLIAKLAMGALAQGDFWGEAPGVRCRNPWNTKQGSSGSSAGSASATSAGCVGFSIGTETQGSISSPSTRCGVTGLRPTYGLVPRTGAMALSWSMDKIGPITRSVEDCAIVLSAIYGPDGHDLAVQPAAFNWDPTYDWKKLRVGYIKSGFEAPSGPAATPPTDPAELEAYNRRMERQKGQLARSAYDMKYATNALEVIRTKMGVTLIPVEIPKFPFGSVGAVLDVEGAAAFESLTRNGRDKLLAAQGQGDWPNIFRTARFYSAVDYIQAMRARTLAIAEMDKLFKTVDIIVCTSQGQQSAATNLCGQPAVIVPNGVRGDDAPAVPDAADGGGQNAGGPGTPLSLTFLGGLYSDARVAAFAHAYQELTGFHKLHPKLA